MKNERKSTVSTDADRMGRFIGQLRTHEGIPLHQLSHGLCSPAFLNRIENGKREVGKQMTDAFFQRLGKPVELFDRILDWGEFQRWKQRQDIISHLCHGEADAARSKANAYLTADAGVLDRQFAQIAEINCCYLEGADAQKLLPMVQDALSLTQPDFGQVPLDAMLLSQNEGRLLFAYLQLREKIEGFDAVTENYRALLKYFKQPRYESRERVYLHPYVACRVVENDYNEGRYSDALAVCEDALAELTIEKRLYAYDDLLEWKQKIYDAMGNSDRMPGKLLEHLKMILAYAPKRTELLIPCDERGNVYCLNQVIRDRRKLLGISQEALAEGICDPRTLIRIENHGGNLHRKNRRALLQRVNMSGERYDYEVITDHYEDYLLRSELDRALTAGMIESARWFFDNLQKRIPDIPTNHQYMIKTLNKLTRFSCRGHCDAISPSETLNQLEEALHLTLPLDPKNISDFPPSILSVNELLLFQSVALCCEKLGHLDECVACLSYAKQCLENTDTSASYYGSLYTQVGLNLASRLGNLGRWDESNTLLRSCLNLSLEHGDSRRIAKYFYGIAWNLLNQPIVHAESKHIIISMLRSAYAAAMFSGDVAGQKHIKKKCLLMCGVELEI